MSQSEKMRMALKLLHEVCEAWNEDNVLNYPQDLPSFDEVVMALEEIEFKEVFN